MASGEGAGRGNLCPGLLWSVLWFFGLIIIGWPVGFLVSWLYIFLLPFGACIEPIRGLCDSILGIVRFPYQFAENMVQMKPCCSWWNGILYSRLPAIGGRTQGIDRSRNSPNGLWNLRENICHFEIICGYLWGTASICMNSKSQILQYGVMSVYAILHVYPINIYDFQEILDSFVK